MTNQLDKIRILETMIQWSDQKQISDHEYKRFLLIADCILQFPKTVSYNLFYKVTRQSYLDIWLPKQLIGILVCNKENLAKAELNRIRIKEAFNRKGIKPRILIVIDGYTNERFKKHKNWINQSNLGKIIGRRSSKAAG